jgi:hypothetical protein
MANDRSLPAPELPKGVDPALVERVAEAMRGSRLMWGLHADRWNDVEWQKRFWTEAAGIALATVNAAQAEATVAEGSS